MEGLAYEYDRELEEISAQHEQSAMPQGLNPNLAYMNNQIPMGYNNQQFPAPRQQGGDAFSRFQAKQQAQSQGQSTFQDLGYNPAKMFSHIKGRKKK